MIVMQRRFSNVIVIETEICPTIEAGAGGGGNNLPMILEKRKEDESNNTDREEVFRMARR